MLSLLPRLSAVCNLFCPSCFSFGTGNLCEGHENEPPVERWAKKVATLTTPDKLIAGHIVENMAKNFDEWKVHSRPSVTEYYHSSHAYEITKREQKEADEWEKRFALLCSEKALINRAIRNSKRDITICYQLLPAAEYDTFYVNGVSISLADGLFIHEAFVKMLKQAEELKAAADKAKREMELNEAKWNLYESIAGYRRNEFGALVPVKTAEDSPPKAKPVRRRKEREKVVDFIEPILGYDVTTGG